MPIRTNLKQQLFTTSMPKSQTPNSSRLMQNTFNLSRTNPTIKKSSKLHHNNMSHWKATTFIARRNRPTWHVAETLTFHFEFFSFGNWLHVFNTSLEVLSSKQYFLAWYCMCNIVSNASLISTVWSFHAKCGKLDFQIPHRLWNSNKF